MKKMIVLLIVLFCFAKYGFAEATDSSGKDGIDTTGKIIDTTDKIPDSSGQIKSTTATTKESDIVVDSRVSKNCKYCVPIYNNDKDVKGVGEWFLILSPFLLLILVVRVVTNNLKDFKFNDALTENAPPKKIVKNPEYNANIITANSGIPNLPILFPPTIEISNIEPSLSDLRAIAATKEATISSIKASLDQATAGKPLLDKAVVDAQAQLDAANNQKLELEQKVTDANTRLTEADQTAKDTAQKLLDDANKAVTDNAAQISDASQKLDAAKKAVDDNLKTITTLTDLLQKAKEEEIVATENVEIAQEAVKNNTTYSINTYRPSISRYIAFITSMVIIILVVCLSSFFIYQYIRTGCPPDFGALTMMLITLGLGITPYITNKISTAASTNKS